MSRPLVVSVALLAALAGPGRPASADGPYLERMRAELAEVRAYVPEPNEVDSEGLRSMLAREATRPPVQVEVELRVRDYLPRGLSPVLLIDGTPVARRYRIVRVEDPITVISFLLDEDKPFTPGGDIRVQYGTEEATKSEPVGAVPLERVKMLDLDAARSSGVMLPQRAK